MKKYLLLSVFACLLSLALYLYLGEIHKGLLLISALAYCAIIHSGYHTWKNPKILPEVEFYKVYKFHRQKGKKIFLREAGQGEGKAVAYNARDIVVSPRVYESPEKWCELVKTPAQHRLEPAC